MQATFELALTPLIMLVSLFFKNLSSPHTPALSFCIELPQFCVCKVGYVLDHERDKSAFSHSESKLKRKLACMRLFVGGTDWQAATLLANSQTQ